MIMKKLLVYLMTAVLIIGPITYTPKAEASGIPTIDIAALVQKLLDYTQQLKAYAEDIYQSTVVANEYVQTLKQMEQIYKEYEHTLNQIKGLKDLIDNTEWKDLLKAIEVDFPLNPLDPYWDDWDPDLFDEDGVAEVDSRVSETMNRIRKIDDVYNDIADSFADGDMRDMQKEKARRLYLKSREITEQSYAADNYKQEQEYINEAFEEMQNYRGDIATGDEAELQTLQILSMQNELLMRMTKQQNSMALKDFEMSNQDAADRKNREAYAYDMQLLDRKEIASRTAYVAEADNNRTASF